MTQAPVGDGLDVGLDRGAAALANRVVIGAHGLLLHGRGGFEGAAQAWVQSPDYRCVMGQCRGLLDSLCRSEGSLELASLRAAWSIDHWARLMLSSIDSTR